MASSRRRTISVLGDRYSSPRPHRSELISNRAFEKLIERLRHAESTRVRETVPQIVGDLLADIKMLESLWQLLDSVFDGEQRASAVYVRLFEELDRVKGSPAVVPIRVRTLRCPLSATPEFKNNADWLIAPINVASLILGRRVACWTCGRSQPPPLQHALDQFVWRLDLLEEIRDLAARGDSNLLDPLLTRATSSTANNELESTDWDDAAYPWSDRFHELAGEMIRLSDPFFSDPSGTIHLVGDVVHADGIETIEPAEGCAADELRILGSGFGALRPHFPDGQIHIILKVGDVYVPIAENSWTDTQIAVTLPDGITSCNVGFVNLFLLSLRAAARQKMHQYLAEADFLFEIPCDPLRIGSEVVETTVVAQTSSLFSILPGTYPYIPAPPFNGNNRLTAGPPEIRGFSAAGLSANGVSGCVEPGGSLLLHGDARFADSVRVRIEAADGSVQLDNAISPADLSSGVSVPLSGDYGFDWLMVIASASNRCGDTTVTRTVWFSGQPAVKGLLLNGASADWSPGSVEPGGYLEILGFVENADFVYIEVKVDNGSILDTRDVSVTEFSQGLTVPVPAWQMTRELTVTATASNACGADTRTGIVVVQKHYDLQIDGIEVTQAIQYYRASEHLADPTDHGSDNSLGLVRDKQAALRVYLRSGQDPSFEAGELQDVDGQMTVERWVNDAWMVVMTSGSRNGLVTARESWPGYHSERSTRDSSLIFVIEAAQMHGFLRVTINVSSSKAIVGGTAESVLYLQLHLEQTLKVAAVAIGYRGPPVGTAAATCTNHESHGPNVWYFSPSRAESTLR